MKTHFSTYLYVACGKEQMAVKHTNIVKDVTCEACKRTKIFKQFDKEFKL